MSAELVWFCVPDGEIAKCARLLAAKDWKGKIAMHSSGALTSDELQALCFYAGANSIFYGERLLTTGNPDVERDRALFERLGLKPMQVSVEDPHGATTHCGITAPEFAGACG